MEPCAAHSDKPAFDISVIIEWENVLLAEDARCLKMLQQLRKQALELPHSFEILVLFNPEQVAKAVVEAEVERQLLVPADDGRTLSCRIEAAPGMHYYELKNHGVELALGQIIVFVDSDVIPEDGWLRGLTEPFWSHPEIKVLTGHTYLDPDNFINRSFALGWTFPFRNDVPVLRESGPRFYPNNLAFRSEVIRANPFPPMPEGMTRGACSKLRASLLRQGIAIWYNSGAQTSHPGPNGLSHFLVRGLAHGRDRGIRSQLKGRSALRTALYALRNAVSESVGVVGRVFRHRGNVGLPAWQAPLAIGLMIVFAIETCLGTWTYLLMPTAAKRWWRI